MSTETPAVAGADTDADMTADTGAYARRVEAILFAASEPLTPSDIRAYAGDGDLGAALATLVADYAPRGINLVERGGRWLFQTAADCAPLLARRTDAPRRLSQAALETLAIIAYHEPATRGDIEEIRGVAPGRGTLDILLDAGLIRPAGRRESAGRPLQYATTPAFLAQFGLGSRRDLPNLRELRAAGLLEPLPAPPVPLAPPAPPLLAPDAAAAGAGGGK